MKFLYFDAHFQAYRIDNTEGEYKVMLIHEVNAISFIIWIVAMVMCT